MDNISKAVGKLTKQSFGNDKQFLVDDTAPSPTGVVMLYVKALTDVTGFSASNAYLQDGSADYPTALAAGIELPAGLYDISVTGGTLICIYK